MGLKNTPTVVRYDADLTDVVWMKRDKIPSDGSIAALPANASEGRPNCQPLEPDSGEFPTMIFRRDLDEWHQPEVGALRALLSDPRLGDDWFTVPTPIGNLALVRPDDEAGGWYVGFVDLAAGEVVLYDGDPIKLSRLGENYPFNGGVLGTHSPSHAATVAALDGCTDG